MLTDREREILNTYLEEGVKLDGFSVLAIRLKRAEKSLSYDFDLVDRALKKMKFSARER